jgi:AraC-like DNA-binding protein
MFEHWKPPVLEKAYFVKGLERLCALTARAGQLWVADQNGIPPTEKREEFRYDNDPRLHVMIEGEHGVIGSWGGIVREVELRPGDVWFFPPRTLSQERWRSPCLYFGIIFRNALVRHLVVDFPGGPSPGVTPWAFHTGSAIAGAGRHALDALCAAADPDQHGNVDITVMRPLVDVVLRLALRHLRSDTTDVSPASRSYRTWRQAVEIISARYGHAIGRESVAAAVGIHPNYLTALCKRYGSASFQQLLEEVRLDRAKHLLRSTNWKLEHVARHCGYANAAYLIRVFRRAVGVTPTAFRSQRQPPAS